MKAYGDLKCRTKPHSLNARDHTLVKQRIQNKASPRFKLSGHLVFTDLPYKPCVRFEPLCLLRLKLFLFDNSSQFSAVDII